MGKVGVTRPDWCRCASVSNGVDGDLAGNFAGLVATHAVGNNKKPLAGMPTVLVLRPNTAGVGAERCG